MSNRGRCRLRNCAALGIFLLMTATAWGQSCLSGSPSFTIVVESAQAVAGAAGSPSYVLEGGGGQLTTGLLMQSTGFRLEGGVVWSVAGFNGGGPVVLGIVPALGSSQGGQSAQIVGFNLISSSGGMPTVTVDGVAAPVSGAVTRTAVTVTMPAGTDGCGNPKSGADLVVTNSSGNGALLDAYSYTPALIMSDAVRIGSNLLVTFVDGIFGDVYIVFAGPPVSCTLVHPSILGGQVVDALFVLTAGLEPKPGPEASFIIAIPFVPALVGAVVPFQAAHLTSFVPIAGGFSNATNVTIIP